MYLSKFQNVFLQKYKLYLNNLVRDVSTIQQLIQHIFLSLPFDIKFSILGELRWKITLLRVFNVCNISKLNSVTKCPQCPILIFISSLCTLDECLCCFSQVYTKVKQYNFGCWNLCVSLEKYSCYFFNVCLQTLSTKLQQYNFEC